MRTSCPSTVMSDWSPGTEPLWSEDCSTRMRYTGQSPGRRRRQRRRSIPDRGGGLWRGPGDRSKTGEKKWDFKMVDYTESGILTTAADLLFSGGREGHFFALDARTGELLWKTNLGWNRRQRPDDVCRGRPSIRGRVRRQRALRLRPAGLKRWLIAENEHLPIQPHREAHRAGLDGPGSQAGASCRVLPGVRTVDHRVIRAGERECRVQVGELHLVEHVVRLELQLDAAILAPGQRDRKAP